MAGREHGAGSLANDLAKALESGEGADLTLVVGDARLRVNSFLLSARSPVFAAMLRRSTAEAASRAVQIGDVEEDVARQLLSFVYTDRAPQLRRMAAQLLAASDRYDLPLLKQQCEEQLVKELTVENAAATVVLAIRHDCPRLKERAVELIKAFPLEVMATASWQQDLCRHPEMASEVSRLIAVPSSTQLYSKSRSRRTGDSENSTSRGGVAELADATRRAAQGPPSPGWATPAVSRTWSFSGDELSLRMLQAAQQGRTEELRALLEAGVDVEAKDGGRNTALHFAACHGHVEAVRCLLEGGADVDARDAHQDSALHWAAGRGHAEVVRLLLAAAASPNARGQYGMTPLHWAALSGHVEVAAELLEAGADQGARDDCGSTPLDLLRRSSHPDVADILV